MLCSMLFYVVLYAVMMQAMFHAIVLQSRMFYDVLCRPMLCSVVVFYAVMLHAMFHEIVLQSIMLYDVLCCVQCCSMLCSML